MVQTRAEAARQKASTPADQTASIPKRRFAVPRDAAVGIMVGIVAAGVLWWILAILYHRLVG